MSFSSDDIIGSNIGSSSDSTSDTSPFSDDFDETVIQARDAIQAWTVIVPVVIGTILLVGIICCCVARRRRRSQTPPPMTACNASHAHQDDSALPVYGANNGYRVPADGGEAGLPVPPDSVELQQQQKQFQYDAPPAYEFDNSDGAAKLSGGSHVQHVGDRSGSQVGQYGCQSRS